MHNRVRVQLPNWIWDTASNNDEFKRNLANYMKRYPGYIVVKIDGTHAICERG